MPDGLNLSHLAPATLSGVAAAIKGDPSLSGTRRRDLLSALRRFAHLLGRDLEAIPASSRMVAQALAGMDLPAKGLSPKTFQNLRSNLLAALRLAAAREPRAAGLSGGWQGLYAQLPDKRLRHGLSRFLRFCQQAGLQPEAIDDAVIDSFIEHLRRDTLLTERQIRESRRRTARLWNEATERLPSWPGRRLSLPTHRTADHAPALSAYPASFQADVVRHLDWLAGKLFLEDPPPRIQKPASLRLRREHIRLAAGAALNRGFALADLSGLAVLSRPTTVRLVAEDYYARNGNEITGFTRDIVSTLIQIARYWVKVDAPTIEQLKALRRRLGTTRAGLTDKNRQTLRVFDDPRNRALLYQVPGRLMAEAGRHAGGRGAVKAQLAFAIALLQAIPLRVGNLARLTVGQHLVREQGRGGRWRLYLDPAETKNGEPLTFVLPEAVAKLLDDYLRNHRRHLPNVESGCLFPGETGGAKTATTLSDQIQKAIAKRTGLGITAHQFRHLAAKIYLDHNPGDYLTVSRLLGHRNLKTTVNFYSELRTEQAGTAFADLLEADRAVASKARGRRRT